MLIKDYIKKYLKSHTHIVLPESRVDCYIVGNSIYIDYDIDYSVDVSRFLIVLKDLELIGVDLVENSYDEGYYGSHENIHLYGSTENLKKEEVEKLIVKQKEL